MVRRGSGRPLFDGSMKLHKISGIALQSIGAVIVAHPGRWGADTLRTMQVKGQKRLTLILICGGRVSALSWLNKVLWPKKMDETNNRRRHNVRFKVFMKGQAESSHWLRIAEIVTLQSCSMQMTFIRKLCLILNYN